MLKSGVFNLKYACLILTALTQSGLLFLTELYNSVSNLYCDISPLFIISIMELSLNPFSLCKKLDSDLDFIKRFDVFNIYILYI